jgi:leucyl aminopeptidase
VSSPTGPISIDLASTAPRGVDLVGVPVAQGPRPLGSGVDAASLKARGFEGKVGETAVLDGVVAVGVGPRDAVTPDVIRRASAALVKAAGKRATLANGLLSAVPENERPAAAAAAAEGTLLGSYSFGRYKKNGGTSTLSRVTLFGRNAKLLQASVDRGVAIATAVNLARDLVNTPSGDLLPADLADVAVAVAAQAGLVVDVVDEAEAEALGLGGIVGVGKGSENPPRLVKLVYEPKRVQPRGTIAFIGKGITFDSGGLSLKTGDGMMAMKTDMGGAAAVLGAMSALPALKPRVRVIAYLCLAENMPSGRAIRPGDVLTIRNGTTVEVLNTDAEGRLVLADGLSLAAEEQPDAMIDLATLTGACVAALGTRIAGLMGNDDGWVGQVNAAADAVGEPVWHLPLPKEYRKVLDSEVADLKNVPTPGYAGALTAGLFLQEFVAGVPWAHLDIAGPSRATDGSDPHIPVGGTGFGVRTLLQLAESFQPVT